MDKEKRLIRFLLASALVMLAFLQIQAIRNPPPAEDEIAEVDGADADGGDAADDPADNDNAANNNPAGDGQDANDNQAAADDDDDDDDVEPAATVANERMVLGSLDPTSPYQMAVYFNNRGAAVEQIDLNNPRYQDLDDKSGYLGALGLSDDPKGGCRVSQVAPGSPASAAGLSAGNAPGEGDRIVAIATDKTKEIGDLTSYRQAMSETKPGDNITVVVMRTTNGAETKTKLTATLVKRPLSLISPEPNQPTEDDPQHPLSFLWTLGKVGDKKVPFGKDEISELPSLRTVNWEMKRLAPENGAAGTSGTGEGVEFTRRLTKAEMSKVGGNAPLELVKRYRLTKVDRSDDATKQDKHGSIGYGIKLEIEIRNLGTAKQKVAYQLDGPTGLTDEGWWYSYKVHPRKFAGAGARDIVWEDPKTGKHQMKTGSMIAGEYKEDSKDKYKNLFDTTDPTRLSYIATDAQYFTVALVPPKAPEGVDPAEMKGNRITKAFAHPVGPIDKKKRKRTDVAFRVTSSDQTIAGGQSFKEEYTIFAGPKEPKVLKEFGLDKCIVYGWFGAVARPMIGILHFFHDRIGLSWGLSIIALTVLVRMLMFPIGRKMALNAQMMQKLAPEMKVIAEKYKDNLEKRGAAQQELFKKHKYNPAIGCLVMPLQMPIFIGLYRGLSVDIGLRQAPFFHGMAWCSNLSAPDKFWHWENVVPGFMSSVCSTEGFLGPFLNILPFITVILFLGQQILFTPPPQDENQAMQQNIMKYMMVFMGIMFHKFASGLCIYMIVSSAWGIGERLLLPKPKVAVAGSGPSGSDGPNRRSGGGGGTPDSPKRSPGSNGAAKAKKKKKKRRK